MSINGPHHCPSLSLSHRVFEKPSTTSRADRFIAAGHEYSVGIERAVSGHLLNPMIRIKTCAFVDIVDADRTTFRFGFNGVASHTSHTKIITLYGILRSVIAAGAQRYGEQKDW